MRREAGFTLVEMLVALALGSVTLLAVYAFIDTSTRSTERVAARVDANQRARVALSQVMERLHSSCVGPGALPIRAGSDGDQLVLLSQSGEQVALRPDKHVIALSGGVLTDSAYAPTPGSTAPDWTFSTTASSRRELIDRVVPASLGDPPATVPTFRYLPYEGGKLSDTPLATPLSADADADNWAGRVAAVSVAFAADTPSVPDDAKGPISVAGSATLRLTPPSDTAGEKATPCT